MPQTQQVRVQFQQESPWGGGQLFYHAFGSLNESILHGSTEKGIQEWSTFGKIIPGMENPCSCHPLSITCPLSPAQVSECFPHSVSGGPLGDHPTNPKNPIRFEAGGWITFIYFPLSKCDYKMSAQQLWIQPVPLLISAFF